MQKRLSDGRLLMAAYEDVDAFFKTHRIEGRVIADLRPACLDYIICNLCDIEDIYNKNCQSAIETDEQICILFEDGDHMEIEIPGDGPIILGFNTANLQNYPVYDGSCYTLRTMFQHCIGKKIEKVKFEKSPYEMEFPCYCGIDMSADDDGIKEILLYLEDGSFLRASGYVDFYELEQCAANGENCMVPYKELLEELSEEERKERLEDW